MERKNWRKNVRKNTKGERADVKMQEKADNENKIG
jgi:hypothetical protein